AELRHQLLVVGLTLGRLLERLPQLVDGLVDLAPQLLLSLEGVLELLAALEVVRLLRRRLLGPARELVERLLDFLRLLRGLLERQTGARLLAVDVVVQLGEAGKAQLELGGPRAARAREPVVVLELEAERGALAGQQAEGW